MPTPAKVGQRLARYLRSQVLLAKVLHPDPRQGRSGLASGGPDGGLGRCSPVVAVLPHAFGELGEVEGATFDQSGQTSGAGLDDHVVVVAQDGLRLPQQLLAEVSAQDEGPSLLVGSERGAGGGRRALGAGRPGADRAGGRGAGGVQQRVQHVLCLLLVFFTFLTDSIHREQQFFSSWKPRAYIDQP